MRAESGYKMTADEAEDNKRQRLMADPTNGFILGRDFNFWRKFIDEDGTPDTEAILAKGYTEEQLPQILDEMTAGGLLGSVELLDSDSVGDSSENA